MKETLHDMGEIAKSIRLHTGTKYPMLGLPPENLTMLRASFIRLMLTASVLVLSTAVFADDPWQVFNPSRLPQDGRLKPFHLDRPANFTAAYSSKDAWEKRAEQLRTQLLVALGLFPLPEKTPLQAVVHGKRDMGDYTIEKVYFASLPGHYVCGNLYRPKNVKGKVPVVLNPHGHFSQGRFTRESDTTVKRDLASKGEDREEGARYPLQAAAVGICRLGCVVFHYDMIGYADTTEPIPHRVGFNALQAELRLQSFLGLQTWNSIRALDFVCGLPDVDTTRIGVTGASGGGTQTFLLCALDSRPTVSFPAVMVSANMQGGCICENASLLRVGTNNVEIAALFAPKPQAMTGADDWTRDIETRGLPELKKIYGLYGAADKVNAKYYPFPHNYNQVSREMIYAWFNQHLKLGKTGSLKEKPFTPVPASELSVFDASHPRPKDWLPADRLLQTMSAAQEEQFAGMSRFQEYQLHQIKMNALKAMCCTGLPSPEATIARQLAFDHHDGYSLWRGTLRRDGMEEEVPLVTVTSDKAKRSGVAVVWADSKGKASLFSKEGKLNPEVQRLLENGASVSCVDTFLTGEWKAIADKPPTIPMVPQKYHKDVPFLGYWLGYNRSLPAQRAHDLLTLIANLKKRKDVKSVWLVGHGDSAPWAGMAAALAGDSLAKVALHDTGFSFSQVNSPEHPMMLPGGLKYFRNINDLYALMNPTKGSYLIKPDSYLNLVDVLLTNTSR